MSGLIEWLRPAPFVALLTLATGLAPVAANDAMLVLRASADAGAMRQSLARRPTAPILKLRASPESPVIRRPARVWRTNEQAIRIIRDAEKLRLKSYYLAGQWLIGYGHAEGTEPDMVITRARAEEFLRADLRICEGAVSSAVDVPVTVNEFSALVALCYNIGGAKFARSHVVLHLNRWNLEQAADAFLNWKRVKIDDATRVAASLVDRRRKERALFLSPPAEIRQIVAQTS
jgi:lysozyme